jgi:hypothetical protein
MIENLFHTFGDFASAHPVITLVGSFAIGFVLGRLPIGRKKDKKG